MIASVVANHLVEASTPQTAFDPESLTLPDGLRDVIHVALRECWGIDACVNLEGSD